MCLVNSLKGQRIGPLGFLSSPPRLPVLTANRNMVARDDSVIRGSLITCLIFLVLSIALNFFLWRSANVSGQEAEDAKSTLRTAQNSARNTSAQMDVLKSMLGFGSLTQAELETMRENARQDPDMAAIEEQFATHMGLFGQDVEPTDRSYKQLPEYLVNAIRDRNQRYSVQVKSVARIQSESDASIQAAREQQSIAEQARDKASQDMDKLTKEFDTRREEMIAEKEKAADTANKTIQALRTAEKESRAKQLELQKENRMKLATIDTQKLELNRLRATNFETTQGEIRSVFGGGKLTTINLGSADKLIPGITFGVIDAGDKRLQDAEVKATIQVTRVQGPYLSTARVIASPRIDNPIIDGDKIYSPFWAPGRVVRIALAGDIDIDGDGKPDNDALKGQIMAAGAEVAAEVSMTGAVDGNLDASVRFLVIGTDPEIERSPDASDEAAVQAVQAIGRIKARAAELGLTIIPAEKLQSYLKTINDSLTTPLGSAAQADDFPPDTNIRTSGTGIPSRIAEIYKKQTEGMQEGNKILPP